VAAGEQVVVQQSVALGNTQPGLQRDGRRREGKVVESGPTLGVIQHTQDPYTELLLDSIPNPVETGGRRQPWVSTS
jgi:ABC-type oligopeptide transport system ATPase subunit